MPKILVIDDEQSFRESLLELLEAEGFQSVGAENGQTGLRLAQQYLPDLILCDIQMPDIDGHQVLAQLRQSHPTATLPFIFLSAKGERYDFRKGMDLGADDYLSKPCTATELLKAITSRLQKQTTIERRSQAQLDHLRHSIALALPHELHTPLNGILGLSQVLIEGYDAIERREILEIAEDIQTSAERLYKLTQHFLLYAELEMMANNPQRMQDLQNDVTDRADVVISQAATRVAQQSGRSADLSLDLQAVGLKISERNLSQIIEELVDNAFKFSRPGSLVQVSSRWEGHTYHLAVTDQGRGMTPDAIANLGGYVQFERKLYEQQGSGLGFIIAKRLVEFHKGEIAIASTPGQQTMIRVVLPMSSF